MIGWNLTVCLNMIQFVKSLSRGNCRETKMLTKETPLKGLMEYSIIKADELHKKHLCMYILWTCLRLDIWYPQGMLGLFCRGILLDIQLYDFVVCLFEQNNIWGNWSIIKFQQGKGITPSQQKNLTNEMLVFVLLL